MKHTVVLPLLLLIATAGAIACSETEPSAEERALAKVRAVYIARPAAYAPFLIGTTEPLTAIALDASNVEMGDAPLTFRWESSDSSVIRVDQDGRITARRAGSAHIYAWLTNGVKGDLLLQADDPATAFAIDPDISRMLVGQRRTLSLAYLYKPVPVSAHGWVSSSPAVATVDDEGVVTAVAPGDATMSVVFGNVTFRADVTVSDVATPLRFASVATGSTTACALTTDGTAFCWGWTVGGALGTAEHVDRCVHWLSFLAPFTGAAIYERTPFTCAMEPVRVATTLRFTSLDAQSEGMSGDLVCGLTTAGEVHCWGARASLTGGTAGPAVVALDTPLRFTSFNTPCGVTASNDAWCFGDPALRGAAATASTTPTQVTGAGIWRTVTGGHAGATHRCGITTSDAVLCWGRNGAGELGTGDTTASTVPVPVQSAEHFSAVAVTRTESCALSLDQRLYCWGAGQTTPTLQSTTLRFTALVPRDDVVCAVGTDAARYCRSAPGAFTNTHPGSRFRFASARGSPFCGILEDALLYCQGGNDFGELGTGDREWRSVLTRVVGQ